MTSKKWHIFKERADIAPELGPPMWVVWSPEFEEYLFSSYSNALLFFRLCALKELL